MILLCSMMDGTPKSHRLTCTVLNNTYFKTYARPGSATIKKSLCSKIVKRIHHCASMQDDGLIVLFSGHAPSARARMARSRVRRIVLRSVIEQLMERMFW